MKNKFKEIEESKADTKEGKFILNSEKSLEKRKEMLEERYLKEGDTKSLSQMLDFYEKIESGTGSKLRIGRKGEEYYRAGRMGGNYLTKEHPGSTPEKRKENLQLPPENKAKEVHKVRLTRPQLVIDSKIKPQVIWAKQVGYKAETKTHQTVLLDARKGEKEDRYSKGV